jgi:putative transposase
MPRNARIVVPDVPHHVTHRGNNRQTVFHHPDDYETYILHLKHYSAIFGLQILGYCLMPNHVHLLVIPRNENSMAKAVGTGHMRFAQIVNKIHGGSGHLWGDRFFSCPIDDTHLVAAMRYTEMNPVRAGLVNTPASYKWSSADVHTGGRDIWDLVDTGYWFEHFTSDEWREFLTEREDKAVITALEKHIQTGKPYGNRDFIRMIERKTGMSFEPGKRGRPKKHK